MKGRGAVVKSLLLAAALTLVGIFLSDYAWTEYRVEHAEDGTALDTVTYYLAAPLKSGRTEIYYDQPQSEICVRALLPHAGFRPCWYATRQTVRVAD